MELVVQLPYVMLPLHRSNKITMTQEQFSKFVRTCVEAESIPWLNDLLDETSFNVDDEVLFEVVENNSCLAVFPKMLLLGNVNARNHKNETLIIAAILENRNAMVKMILETNKCDLSLQDDDKRDAMYYVEDDSDVKQIYEEYKANKKNLEQQAAIAELQKTVASLQTKMQSVEEKLTQVLALLAQK